MVSMGLRANQGSGIGSSGLRGDSRSQVNAAADLQRLADEHLLGGIDLGKGLDPPGDLGGDAAAILDDRASSCASRESAVPW